MSELQLRDLSPVNQEKVQLLHEMDNALGRLDYKFFVMEVLGCSWPEMFDPRLQEHLDRQSRILHSYLDHRHEQKKFRKIMDVRPRGTGKSSTGSIPMGPWLHLHDPDIACAIMSAEYDKMAKKFSTAVKNTWEGSAKDSRLVDLYGTFKPEGREAKWSADKMVTNRRQATARPDPTMAAYSIPQGPVSGHFDFFVIDDPVTDELMMRDSQWLEKVWAAYLRMKFVVNSHGLLYLIMTRYHDADLIGRIIAEEIEPAVREHHEGRLPKDFNHDRGWIKYAHLAGWEVFYDSVYEDYDPKTKTGKLVYPVIWNQDKIEDVRKTAQGEALFWSQLMNSPSAREDNPLKRFHIDQLFVPTIRDVPKRAMRTIDIHCDFAFKTKQGEIEQSGDDSVMHIVAKEGGYVYRLDGWRGKVTQDKFGEILMRQVEKVHFDWNSKVRYVTFELAQGHGSGNTTTEDWLRQLMKRHPDLPRFIPFPIRRYADKGNRSKWDRIESTNWAWQEGYVVLVESGQFLDPLIYQMLNQRTARCDDDADSFADWSQEGIYKKGPRSEIPAGFSQFMPGHNGWTPQPAVHGNIDPRTGEFHATRLGARDHGKLDAMSPLSRMLQARSYRQ